MSEKEFFMGRALDLAAKGLGRTGTNPVVGAVVVKNGKIIGSGYHKKQGGNHAEVSALNSLVGTSAKGATMYVTLEPCVYSKGKLTPPCADLLMKSGLRSIEIAVKDPNPSVAGRGIRMLRKAGLSVNVGLLGVGAAKLNEYYFRSVVSRRPFVTLKLAMSADGRIATSSGESKWITGVESRKYVHRLRASHQAILTTSSTVLADDPHLGVRLVKGKDPLRIIVDREGKLNRSMRVFRDVNYLIITGKPCSGGKEILAGGCECNHLHYKNDVPIKKYLPDLYKSRVGSILVEAGSAFSAALLKEGVVDKCVFFIAPVIIGGDGLPAIGGLGIDKIRKALKLYKVRYETFGDDILMEGYL